MHHGLLAWLTMGMLALTEMEMDIDIDMGSGPVVSAAAEQPIVRATTPALVPLYRGTTVDLSRRYPTPLTLPR